LAPLTDGDFNLSVQVSDPAGNNAAAVTRSFSLDRVAPTVALASDKTALKVGDSANISFTFSENPGNSFQWDGSSGDLLVSGGRLSAITGTGLTRSAVFTPSANSTAAAQISLADGSFSDSAGNTNADGADSNNRLTMPVDTVLPQVTAISLGSKTGAQTDAQSEWLNAGDTIDVNLVFNKAMQVVGVPVVKLQIGNATVDASYASGSGQNTWVMRATITSGLNDNAGVALAANALQLPAGASIQDAAGNPAVLDFPAVVANPLYKVDTTAPTLTLDAVTGDDLVNLADKTAGVALSGSSDAVGRNISVSWGNQNLTTTVGTDGRWRIEVPTLPAEGNAAVSVQLSDAAGNASSAQRSTRVDTVAPSLSLSQPLTDGAGTNSNADNLLNRAEFQAAVQAGGLTLRGASNAEDASSVAVRLNGKTYTGAVQNGTWSITVPSADLGTWVNGSDYALQVGVRDSAGNPAPSISDTLLVRLDSSDVPTVQSLLTNSLTPQVGGTAQKISTDSAGQHRLVGGRRQRQNLHLGRRHHPRVGGHRHLGRPVGRQPQRHGQLCPKHRCQPDL
jgi:hypothetical protein